MCDERIGAGRERFKPGDVVLSGIVPGLVIRVLRPGVNERGCAWAEGAFYRVAWSDGEVSNWHDSKLKASIYMDPGVVERHVRIAMHERLIKNAASMLGEYASGTGSLGQEIPKEALVRRMQATCGVIYDTLEEYASELVHTKEIDPLSRWSAAEEEVRAVAARNIQETAHAGNMETAQAALDVMLPQEEGDINDL